MQISTRPTLNYAICNVYSPNLVSSGSTKISDYKITPNPHVAKNLFKTLTSKRYITLALIATTHWQKVNLFLNNPALSC